MKLPGKIALVTGASSGIGRAVSEALVRESVSVTLLARNAEELERVAELIRTAGGSALVMPCDIRDEPQVIRALEQSRTHWGGLDILVNAAGVGLQTTIEHGRLEDWRQMFDVNVLGLAVACREALKHFDSARGGHIVHVSSMAGHRVPPRGGMYAATKFAVRALAEVMRTELLQSGNPTRVTAVSPGLVETNFFENYYHGDQEKVREVMTRYDRILDPGDVAEAVLYALSAPEHVQVHDILLRSSDQVT